ncbi:carboxylesterase [Dechloromonas sp. ZY10]|uniref:alpha/beta hydrolase n=1 Tax=Dechloromonas aquae TaxID=2664436 RepID=UPI00352809E9
MSDFFSEPAIELVTGQTPRFTLIWLHGLGADGSDFVPVVSELGVSAEWPGRFVFPHAPWRRVTCNGGYEMRAWYDILSLRPAAREINEEHLQAACGAVQGLIERELVRGIPPERVFLAGFSQGGAVAYATGLPAPWRLGGVIALSTYVANESALKGRCRNDIALFAAHGADDDVVAPVLGRRAFAMAVEEGVGDAEWHDYPLAHQVSLEEVRAIGDWLERQLSAVQA